MTPELWKLLIILLFAFGVVGGGMAMEIERRRAALDVIKKAIESGQALDPKLANALTGQREFDPGTLLFPGIMTMALSIGLSGASFAFGQPKLLGGAVIMFCLSVGLIVSSKILPRPAKDDADLPPSN